MLKLNQVITGVTATALTLSFSVGAIYQPEGDAGTDPLLDDLLKPQIQQPLPTDGSEGGVVDQSLTRYLSFYGTVKEVYELENGGTRVLLESLDGALCSFNVTEDTFQLTGNEIKEGAKVTGFYDGTLPAIMIYPPQYTAVVMAVDMEEMTSPYMGEFDANLVSQDNYMQMIISEQTQILDVNGKPYTGDTLVGKTLIVEYGIMTRSFPGQTTPSKIIVFSEEGTDSGDHNGDGYVTAVPPIYQLSEEEMARFALMQQVEGAPIVVETITIDAPSAYVNEDSVVMVPLRAISEALGLTVTWNEADQTVLVGETLVTIGSDAYKNAQAEAVTLEGAAIVQEGTTYVPLAFFKTVLGQNNAYLLEGQIVVDNGEVME